MRHVVLGMLLLAAPVSAEEILDSWVTHDAGVYRMSVDINIQAPPLVVHQRITDYAHLPEINPSIEESEILQVLGPYRHRVRSIVNVCILFYCRRVNQVQDITQANRNTIMAVTLPELSDFRRGLALWWLRENGAATRLQFSAEFEPDFWVPPLIGPWLIKRKLVYEVAETARRIERTAHAGGAGG